ncbi:putative RNA-directed DNA polymerase from transposon BS [Trichonephila clavata]|uniref:Putative RNA-directed DNA polymerase from transposon BS n=1 Tax=Trichonephila clavata TaxID=2740835 RepID=A0A8X6IQ57_TRICU|nr:putative RNA-directed DNA polymerase from transposon BS [Trichonephila clavata]
MLQHLSESSILSLLLLFNRIWETQVFPTQWCHAHVLPFPKPGKDPTSANNYRPIAFTSCLSKLMERIISARLMFHLESHNLLSPLQSAFRKSRSTTDNLIRLETSIREAFVKKQYNISVFFDIKKAYDMSWRYGILRDLYAMDIRGNLPFFIKNFLSHRSFQCSLYVDDVQISYSSKFLNVAERQIQTTINNFTKWAEQNGCVFSTEKTISKIRSAKALNILKVLANTRWGADRTSLLRLYRALIRSKLDYGSVVYSSACKFLLKILDPVHHQGLRLCLGAFRTSPVESLYAEAYEPPLDLRRKLRFIIYTDSLSALQSIVSLHSSSHPILVDITYALANHLKKKDIRFCWIPGHAGITGNELADTAARSVTGSSERFPIPHSDLKACFRQKLQSVWQSSWDQQTENKLHSVIPVLAPTVQSSSNRREQVIWTRLRLGYTRLTHRHLLFGEPPPYCEICNVSLSVKHILCDCPHSNHLRYWLFNSVDFTISSILNNSTNSSLVFKFLSIKGFIHHI